ncbi:MAG: hypothetical protein HPY53_01510 [Brevinematales bacterium]|nr:hypothetical protein [Brevinematales bacterium]
MKPNVIVYSALPMSGRKIEDVKEQACLNELFLKNIGFEVINPYRNLKLVIGANEQTVRNGIVQKTTNEVVSKTIVGTCLKSVLSADILVVDFRGAKEVSQGCITEIAWTYLFENKNTVIIMEDGNLHHHDFIFGMSDRVYSCFDEAENYLCELRDIHIRRKYPAAEDLSEETYMPKVNDQSFHCSCGANVFKKMKTDQSVYICNSCGLQYRGI